MKSLSTTIEQLMAGAYDLHIHAAPSPFHRTLDDFGLLKEAGKTGMAGILLKSHYESTAARAEIANRHCASCTTAYGGIALNWPAGGLNPYAAENALKRGCKIVWMPTRDSRNSLASGNMPGDFFKRNGITILNESGDLKPEVLEILTIVKRYDAAIATGHLSPEESILLCRKGAAFGVRMILTHPEFDRTVIDAATQKELADSGVFIEKCWYNIAEHNCTAEEMVQTIRTVGYSHCFLTTDRGQANREHPTEALRMFLNTLLQHGITQQELYVMTHITPSQILGNPLPT